MKKITVNDRADLRQFGLGFAALLWLFFWLILPGWFGYDRPQWPLWLAPPIALVALLMPKAIYPLFRVWMLIAAPLAWFNTRLLLGAVFFVLLTPLGLVLYWRGKLHFKQGFDAKAASYKQPRQGFDPKQMEFPF